MRGFIQLYPSIATWKVWNWQEIGACLLALDFVLFGVLAAYWREAAPVGGAAGGVGPDDVDDPAFRLAGWKRYSDDGSPVRRAKQPTVDEGARSEQDVTCEGATGTDKTRERDS